MDRTKAFTDRKPSGMPGGMKPKSKPPFISMEEEQENSGPELEIKMASPSPSGESAMGAKGMGQPSLAVENMGMGGKASMDKAGLMKAEEKCDTCRHFTGQDCNKVDVQFDDQDLDPSLVVCEKFYEPKEGSESAPMEDAKSTPAPPTTAPARSPMPSA